MATTKTPWYIVPSEFIHPTSYFPDGGLTWMTHNRGGMKRSGPRELTDMRLKLVSPWATLRKAPQDRDMRKNTNKQLLRKSMDDI
jgi:hypothetical protein